MNLDAEYEIVDKWYEENVSAKEYEVMDTLLGIEAFKLINESILDEDEDEPVQLDNDFGECYWNGTRMVEKPSSSEYFND